MGFWLITISEINFIAIAGIELNYANTWWYD